jgi:hypothetical protein
MVCTYCKNYTATNGSDVVLTVGAAVSDIVEVISYETFAVLDQTFTGTTTVDVLDVTGAATGTDLTLSGGVYLGGTGAANLLDDYEEGTWTPVVSDASTAGNLATITNVRGNYTKTGNQVTIHFNLNNITTTGMTAGNDFYIQGMPFTPPSYTTPNLNYQGTVRLQNVLYSGYAVVEVQDNNSYMTVKEVRSGSVSANLLVSDITSGTADISISLTYETA